VSRAERQAAELAPAELTPDWRARELPTE